MPETISADSIIEAGPFSLRHGEKEKTLLDIIRPQLIKSSEICREIKSLYSAYGFDPRKTECLADIVPVPSQMFKLFDLVSTDKSSIVRILESSGTTSSIPSKIYIDKSTSFRQSKALVSVLRNFLGDKRMPLIIIDSADMNKRDSEMLKARGAAMRGIQGFSTSTTYAMDTVDGNLATNFDRTKEFVKTGGLIFGFTYIIWSTFLKDLEERKIRLDMKGSKLLHSGGGKKLAASGVTKEDFKNKISELLNIRKNDVIDFYGMVESLGVIFMDCEEANKHVPDFSDVIIRDPVTFEECHDGTPGLIEVISAIPESYPGHAILTEDIGQ